MVCQCVQCDLYCCWIIGCGGNVYVQYFFCFIGEIGSLVYYWLEYVGGVGVVLFVEGLFGEDGGQVGDVGLCVGWYWIVCVVEYWCFVEVQFDQVDCYQLHYFVGEVFVRLCVCGCGFVVVQYVQVYVYVVGQGYVFQQCVEVVEGVGVQYVCIGCGYWYGLGGSEVWQVDYEDFVQCQYDVLV